LGEKGRGEGRRGGEDRPPYVHWTERKGKKNFGGEREKRKKENSGA